MFIYSVGLLIIILLYIAFLTPYPFVWLLKSKKEEMRDKSPENIEVIKEGISVVTNLSYPSKYPQATYDLYVPKNSPIKTLIVWVHGGSFIAGTSIGMRNFGPLLASNGYVVCAMNYAYAPRFSFPTQIRQVDEMLCHICKKYHQEEITIENIILGGDSAGANIVASYASMYKNETLASKAKVTLYNTTPIKGLLLFCGPYNFCEDFTKEEFKEFRVFMKYIGWSYLGHKNWWRRQEKDLASPLLNVHPQFVPAYICDGKKFSFMWQGKKLAEAMQSYGIYTKTRFYPEMSHEFQFEYKKHPKEAMQVYYDSLEFLQEVLKEEAEC